METEFVGAASAATNVCPEGTWSAKTAKSGHLESPRTSPSLPQQSGRGESGQKRSEPTNIGALIPEECVVMGAANLQ